MVCVAFPPLRYWLLGCGIAALALGSLKAGNFTGSPILYGIGEGDFGTNGVGQTSGVIPNPMAGDYRWGWHDTSGDYDQGWFPQIGLPSGRKYYDDYKRFVWRALEREAGNYTAGLQLLEWHLSQAEARGRRFAFRVMILSEYEGDVDGDGQTDGLTGVPDYIANNSTLGRRFASDKPECNGIFIPYWNHPAFLERVEALLNALGAAFDGDERLAYVDIGIYGHWGEWHMSGMGLASVPPEINATVSTRHRLIDILNAAFPRTRLLMLPDIDGDYPDRSGAGFSYAMQNYPRMGVRKDNLSNIWFEQEVSEWFPIIRNHFLNRWRTTPFVTEFFGGENEAALQLAESQVIRYHVSMVATNQWHNSPQRIEVGKAAGHRFRLESASWPSSVPAGHAFQLVSSWSNVGVAPAYENWAPTWELYAGNGTRVWAARSHLDLQRLLPTTVNPDDDVNTEDANNPVVITDHLAVPASLPAGNYTLRLRVPLLLGNGTQHRYLPPLALATQGRDAQGRYLLGSLTVTAPAQPAPVVTLSGPPQVFEGTPANFTVSVSSNASVSLVQLLADGAVVGSDATAPYEFSWIPPGPGVYTLVARATDSGNRTGASMPLSYEVSLPTNNAPQVTLTASPSGPYTAPALLTLQATVTDSDGDAISRVEFYRGTTLLANITASPYVASTGPLGAGVHTLLAKAYDNRGKMGVAALDVTVTNPPKGPFGGSPRIITSLIQLEDYDEGGSGISWWDTTPSNQGGAYRNDSVDIQATGDAGGGYHIGWVEPNEWLEFTVQVPETNDYFLQLRYASPPNTGNPVVSLSVNGTPAWSNLSLPTNGRWDWDFENWSTWQSPSPVKLSKGLHVLRLTFGAGGLANYNWMTFVPAGSQSYADWAQDAGLSGSQAAAHADPDSDGVANLLEYALGGIPTDSSSRPQTLVGTTFYSGQQRLTLTFTPERVSGLVYIMEASSDLVSWPEQTPITHLLTPGEPYTFRDSANLAATPRRFLRLRVRVAD